MDCSLPGSSIVGIFQARVLQWVAMSFSKARRRGQITPRPSWAPSQLLAPSLPAEPQFSPHPAPPLQRLPACSPHWPWSSCKCCDHRTSKTTVPGMLRTSEQWVWLLPKATDQAPGPDTTQTPSSHPTAALTATWLTMLQTLTWLYSWGDTEYLTPRRHN